MNEIDKLISDLKFVWERWHWNAQETERLKAKGDTNWVFCAGAAEGYRLEYGPLFDKLTRKMKEMNDGRSVIDLLDNYDRIHGLGWYSERYQNNFL